MLHRHRHIIYSQLWLVSTERNGSLQYGRQLFPFVRSCEWYQNKEPYRTTFLVPFCRGTSTAKGGAKLNAEVDWLKEIKLLLHSFRSAVRVGIIIYISVHVRKHK